MKILSHRRKQFFMKSLNIVSLQTVQLLTLYPRVRNPLSKTCTPIFMVCYSQWLKYKTTQRFIRETRQGKSTEWALLARSLSGVHARPKMSLEHTTHTKWKRAARPDTSGVYVYAVSRTCKFMMTETDYREPTGGCLWDSVFFLGWWEVSRIR